MKKPRMVPVLPTNAEDERLIDDHLSGLPDFRSEGESLGERPETLEGGLTDDLLLELVDHPSWPDRYPAPPRRLSRPTDRWLTLTDGYRDRWTGMRWEYVGGGQHAPRLDDSATLGILRSLIRGPHTTHDRGTAGSHKIVFDGHDGRRHSTPLLSEGEAVVRVLLAQRIPDSCPQK